MGDKLFKNKNYLRLIVILLVAFTLGFFGRDLFSQTTASLGGAAGALANQVACDNTPLSNADPYGIVLADPLNLRTGPGLAFGVITMLDICTPVKLEGRNGDYYPWLEVSLPGNLGGWIFSGYPAFPYVQSNVDLSTLKVTTGAGGPTTNTSPSGGSEVSVVIQYGQVAAFVSGMPANTLISATLNPPSGYGAKSLAVASGQSDSDGNITLTFPMPAVWADGTAVKSGNLTLDVSGGGKSMTAFITYYTY